MNVKRTATIVVAGGVFAAWISAAMTPGGHPVAPASSAAPTLVDIRGAELASEISRLHERLRPDAMVLQPGRNLFSFHTALAAPPTPKAPALAEQAPAPAPALPQQVLKLEGLAEDQSPDGPVRTAIISGGGQLFIVQEGASVPPVYRVAKISADVVELVDSRDGSTRRLALK